VGHYWIRAGLYLVDNEFRYITILRIIRSFIKEQKKNFNHFFLIFDK